MKLGLFTLIFGAFLFFVGPAFAAFSVPSPTGFVTDTSGKLSADQKATLESKLRGFEINSNNEIAVLIVPSLGGESIEDATQEVFNSWKVGKAGLDNGILLVIAVGDRKDRIQTGKGVEGDLTDLQSHNILNSLRPYLHSNPPDWAGAVNSAVDQINGTLESRKGQKVDPGKGAAFGSTSAANNSHEASCQTAPVGISGSWIMLIGLGIIGIILTIRRLFRSTNDVQIPSTVAPCVNCGPTNMKPINSNPYPKMEPSKLAAYVGTVEPTYKKMVPRYESKTPIYPLYDAPGIPSMSTGYEKPIEKRIEATVALIEENASNIKSH